ncbi:MAG TPA: SRPBCC family protein [Gemmatimonadaceae bacterium]|jgi:ribosome-associated toxin RatA of RatAB toxin-antitoxin module
MTDAIREPYELGPMPLGRPTEIVDERVVRAPWRSIFDLARRVEEWPAYLPHYRYVRFRERASDGGGLVEMSADRPFGLFGWPTWWLSEMSVDEGAPAIRYRHVGGITKGMDVEWSFRTTSSNGTQVKILHVWDGPAIPFAGIPVATMIIGPVFIHGIASRTLEGLARMAERSSPAPVMAGVRG